MFGLFKDFGLGRIYGFNCQAQNEEERKNLEISLHRNSSYLGYRVYLVGLHLPITKGDGPKQAFFTSKLRSLEKRGCAGV